MGVPEKLAMQAADRLGVPVLAAAMVVPPGATLYKSFAPKSGTLIAGGPIAAAIASKVAGAIGDGAAATVPTSQGVLAVTADHVVFLKKKLLGVGAGDKLIEWPRATVMCTFEEAGRWKYPGLLIQFDDGTHCTLYGEKRWGLDGIANA